MSVPAVAKETLVPGYAPPLAWFLRRRVVGAPGQRMDWEDVYRAFAGPGTGWMSPPDRRAFALAMRHICALRGVRIEIAGECVYCPDCALR
jgi:hypothetical protein